MPLSDLSLISSDLLPNRLDGDGETRTITALISSLNLQSNIEGGYFVETDRDKTRIPNPFLSQKPSSLATSQVQSSTRNASTTIHYLLTPASPVGHFHRNKGRIIHTLHHGRGRYVIIHADEVAETGGKARIESFLVGPDPTKGERLQWIVEDGKFKASFLLPDDEGTSESSGGLLISETVIPGFEYADHDFMSSGTLDALVQPKEAVQLAWLLPNIQLAN